MRPKIWVITTTAAMGALLFTSGCTKKPPLIPAPQEKPAPIIIKASPPPPTLDTAALRRQQIQTRISEVFKPIYFDYDKSDLKTNHRAACAAMGELMKEYPEITVRVEGNTDERGTEEYNLALGDRRAKEVQTYLVNYGVASSRISTISYGKREARR